MSAPTTTESIDRSTLTGSITALTGTIRIRLRTRARLRNLELFLLLIAVAIGLAAITLVQLGALERIEPSMLWLYGGLGALVLIGHLVLRVVARDADPFLMPIATALGGLGVAGIYRVDLAYGYEGWDSAGVRQIVWMAIAIVVAFASLAIIRNHRVLQRYRYIAMVVGLALLLLPMLPGIGQEIRGARLWISLGPLSFQPGELAKIALAIFFAGYLVTARESLSIVGRKVLGVRFPRVRDLGPILVIWAAAMAVLVVQRDLGTSLLYFGLFLVMIYVATGRASWVLLGGGLFLGGAFVAARSLPYVQSRFTAWLDPFSDENFYGSGFQIVQGIFGLANGGMAGTGFGRGRPDLVVFAESDYIIATLGEELGLIGLFAILALYLLFVSRGFRLGFVGNDDFGKLLAVGLSFVVALQVFIVVGGITRIIPLTGLTTPFLAAGGSSLVANWIIIGLLLRLSDAMRQPQGAAA